MTGEVISEGLALVVVGLAPFGVFDLRRRFRDRRRASAGPVVGDDGPARRVVGLADRFEASGSFAGFNLRERELLAALGLAPGGIVTARRSLRPDTAQLVCDDHDEFDHHYYDQFYDLYHDDHGADDDDNGADQYDLHDHMLGPFGIDNDYRGPGGRPALRALVERRYEAL